ncbi:uncharacterized protein LOC111595535 [Drosophila hydei]|uniref:Uncharacterized protein LOC111595535 n=1 Tax=Drosophila hydei TaxID=7224 RepID=A0A6J1LKA4_DROHY|nr:uncharacterized protein LOC111595535 [Drosophila hydei]
MFNMLLGRSLLVLCLGLLLCCESLPPRSWVNSTVSTMQHQKSNLTPQSTNLSTTPILQSIFTLPEICREGFKLTGDPQRCRKIA